MGELGTGGFGATTGWHSRVQASWPTQAGQGEGTRGGRSVKWVWSFLTLAARWEKCINALAALRLRLSITGGFVPPADPSQPRAEQASCSEGRPKRAIPYLWPRFLHVPFLQVVSRKLWHQLEQPERREERTASDGWSWGVSGRTAHPALAPGPRPTRRLWMDGRFGPTPPQQPPGEAPGPNPTSPMRSGGASPPPAAAGAPQASPEVQFASKTSLTRAACASPFPRTPLPTATRPGDIFNAA